MKTYSAIFTILFLLLIFSCKKPEKISTLVSTPFQEICDSLPPEPQTGWNYTTPKKNLNYSKPVYDPHDKNILYFISGDTTGKIFLLWRLNRLNNTKSLLDDRVLNHPQINNNGWLVYFKFDWNIYKIKTNGDSLTQLTFDGDAQYPVWTGDGQFIYYISSAGGTVYKMNSKGSGKIVIPSAGGSVFATDTLLFYGTMDPIADMMGVKERNMKTGVEKQVILTDVSNTSLKSIQQFFYNEKTYNFYWSNGYGLYKKNLITNEQITVINNPCFKTKYNIFYSLSPITGKIAATVVSSKVANEIDFYSEYHLYEYNMYGYSPQEIIIP
ncbi:MAG: hypothetical protein HYX39_12680 [Bacteroidetes bacterium]|nr:hypothetical protein [Bacteroidota bacterium]